MATEYTGELEPMDFEESFATSSSSAGDTLFDQTVGHIEDLIMEDEFQSLQQAFLEKYYMEFEDTEENKFIYTDIHNEYIALIERYLEQQLKTRMPEFSMEQFSNTLISRKEELEGEVFEILLTFSDFLVFKEMFLDYRAEKEGNTVDLSEGIMITSLTPRLESSSSGADLGEGNSQAAGTQPDLGLSATHPGLSIHTPAMPSSLAVQGISSQTEKPPAQIGQ